MLRAHFKMYAPRTYLFERQCASHPYDARSLQQVLKQAIKKAALTTPVPLPWLRHIDGTHLLESGTDVWYVQEL